jgi:SynChlorMet cassette radical SAM/SPASM protein ScmF
MGKFALSSIYFNATQHCNLLCKHCWLSPPFVQDKNAYEDKVKNDLSLEEMKPAINEALDLGLTGIKLTGGEPFLRGDLIDFIKFFHEKGLEIQIETNGTLIDKDMARKLKRFNGMAISVSLDGPSSGVHDTFRGVKGAFAQTLRGIECLAKEDMPIQLVFSLHRGNLGSLWDAISLAKDLKADSIKINIISSMGRGSHMIKKGETVNLRELLDLNGQIEDLDNNGINILFDLPVAFQSIESMFSCLKGSCNIHNIIGILADGSLSFCGVGKNEPSLIMGNIREDSLGAIWHRHPLLMRMRQEVPGKLEGICRRCIFKDRCLGGCRAEVYGNHGNFTAPYGICEEAHQKGLFPKTRIIA